MNPLLPSTSDGVVLIVACVAIVLSAAALLSVIIAAPRLSGRALSVRLLVVALVPFVGPVSWFVVRRRQPPRSTVTDPGAQPASTDDLAALRGGSSADQARLRDRRAVRSAHGSAGPSPAGDVADRTEQRDRCQDRR